MSDICVGVGFGSGARSADFVSAIQLVLGLENSGSTLILDCLATLDRKAAEPALREAARILGVAIRGFSAEELASVDTPTPSRRVRAETGSPSVAEAAAILAAGGGPLIVTKTSAHGIALAAARRVS